MLLRPRWLLAYSKHYEAEYKRCGVTGMGTVLFVCTGNTCRSSMAAALAKAMLKGEQVEVLSAGTSAEDGFPASTEAIRVMAEEGIDLHGHRTRRLSREMAEKADLILTMTLLQKEQVLRLVPEAQGKVFTLKEYALGGAGREKVEEEVLRLAASLEAKERSFYGEYGGRIEELERRKAELASELCRVEEEIDKMYRKLAESTFEERSELERIKKEAYEIEDPVGKPLEEYRSCLRELKQAVSEALDRFLGKKGE